MHLLTSPFTFLQIAVFAIAVAAFLLAVRFFIVSQRKLEGLLPERQREAPSFDIGIDRAGFLVPAGRGKTVAKREQRVETDTKGEIKELRNMVQLQQLELNRALRQLQSLQDGKEPEVCKEDAVEKEEPYDSGEGGGDDFLIEELRSQIRAKEAELQDLRQEAGLAQKLRLHFEEVQASHDALQEKVQQMEGGAWQSAELAATVDALQHTVERLEETVYKKEEKIRELSAENARLYELHHGAEEKVSAVVLQRQQLTKKVHFLEQINGDMQQMSDAARKLKTETRRVGELESMLDLITEERDALLKRKRV